MNYRNCSVTLLLLLLLLLLHLPLDFTRAENRLMNRSKRMSSPMLDERTKEVAKFVVSIRSRRPQIIFGDNHFCGGAIIAPTFVLTAANCAMNKRKVAHITRSLVVVGGTPNRLKFVDNSVTLPVEKIFVPQNFTDANSNNIALLKLRGSWPTDNPSIAIISLPITEPIYGNKYLVLGWGRFYKGGPLAGNLVHIDVKLLERNNCAIILKDLKPEMLCAGNLLDKLDENPCAGDTGAPMISNNTVIGVVSYRIGCGSKSLPSIYTDVWYHIDWINDILSRSVSPVQVKLYILMFAMTLLLVLAA